MRFIKYYVPDFDDSEYSQDEVHAALKNGVVLCKLINAISPRNEVRINLGIFKNGEQMLQKEELENIGKFIDAAVQFGIKQEDVFQPAQLHEKTNMTKVVNMINALGKKVNPSGRPLFR